MKITHDRIRDAVYEGNRTHKVAPIAGEFLRTVLFALFLEDEEEPEKKPDPFGTKLELEAAAEFLFGALDVDRIGDEKGELAKKYLGTLLDIARDNL